MTYKEKAQKKIDEELVEKLEEYKVNKAKECLNNIKRWEKSIKEAKKELEGVEDIAKIPENNSILNSFSTYSDMFYRR